MAIQDVRPFVRGVFTNLGFAEHTDGFNTDNVGESIIDDKFHLGPVNDLVAVSVGNQQHELGYALTVTVFKVGVHRNDTSEDVDAVDQVLDTILRSLLSVAVRNIGDSTIKDVSLDAARQLPLDATNDNIIRLELDLTVSLTECFN